MANGAQPRQIRTSGSPEAGSASLVKSSPSRIRPPHREHDRSRSARYSDARVPVSGAASPALSLCGLPRFTFPTRFMTSPRRPLVSTALLLVVAEEVAGVLLHVLPAVVLQKFLITQYIEVDAYPLTQLIVANMLFATQPFEEQEPNSDMTLPPRADTAVTIYLSPAPGGGVHA